MGRQWAVYVDLQLAGRLHNGTGDLRAEVAVLVENLREFGLDTLYLDGYCTVTRDRSGDDAVARIEFELKSRGGWTPLILEVRQPYTAVLYDR